MSTVLDVLENHFALLGTKTAIRCPHGALSYAQLDERSRAVAAALADAGVTRGSIVPLLMERSCDYLVGLLGILRAGCAYLPLSGDLPTQRLRDISSRPGVAPFLCHDQTAGIAGKAGRSLLLSDLERGADKGAALDDLRPEPGDLAYLILTSGSTGRPKAVEIRHDALATRMQDLTERFGVTQADRCSFMSAVGFDAAVFELWTALLSGATIVVTSDEDKLSPSGFFEFLRGEDISFGWLPTPLAEVLFARWPECGLALPKLRLLTTGGERLRRRPPSDFPCPVENMYGPSEATVVATSGSIAAEGQEDGLPHIGSAVGSCKLRLLDENLKPVSPGEEGSVYLSGTGISSGYHWEPELTAERFIRDPDDIGGGTVMYATGDRCVVDESGNLHFLGRDDEQVKIRGYRIEIGEIESAMLSIDGVDQAAVAVKAAPGQGEDELFGYYAGAAVTAERVETELLKTLPAYMIPRQIIMLPQLPLNANGKVDKASLPLPEVKLARKTAHHAGGELGRIIALFEESLGQAVDENTDFFISGGHSIGAILLLERVFDETGSKVPYKRFFENPTPAQLASYLAEYRGAGSRAPVTAGERSMRRFPVSSHQRACWLEIQRLDYSKAYHFKARILFRGKLDQALLETALTDVHDVTEMYRVHIEVEDGEAYQVIAPAEPIRLPLVDLSHLPSEEAEAKDIELLDGEVNDAFDLGDRSLVRMQLIKHSDELHVLQLVEHHLVHDGWSFNVFLDQFFDVLKARLRGETAVIDPGASYVDYATMQQEWLQSEEADKQRNYWLQKLAGGSSELNLPKQGTPVPAEQRTDGARRFTIDREVWDACDALCKELRITKYAYAVSVLKLVLARYSNQQEIMIGAAFANRNWTGFKNTIGMFVNPVVLRDQIDQSKPWVDYLRQVTNTVLEAHDNQELPFDEIVRAMRPAGTAGLQAFYQVMMGFHDTEFPQTEIPGLDVDVIEGYTSGSCKLDMTFIMIPRRGLPGDNDPIHAVCEFRSDLYDGAFVDGMLASFVKLFEDGLRDIGRPLSAMASTSGTQRSVIGQPVRRADWPAFPTLDGLFSERAARHPQALAIDDGKTRLTFAELEARSDALATEIQARGGFDRVGILSDRSAEAAVAILATLKSGAAFVPLDPKLPEKRLSFMVEDAGLKLVLASRQAVGLSPTLAPNLIVIDDVDWRAERGAPAARTHGCGDAAYVIYTSGSSGTPKGVIVPHRGMANLIADMDRLSPITGEGSATWLAAIGFDVSLYEFFSALSAGLCLRPVPAEAAENEALYPEWLAANDIAAAWLPPYLVKATAEAASSGQFDLPLQRVLTGVEPVDEGFLRALRRTIPSCRVVNGYGPTEASVACTLYAVPEEDAADLTIAPIGKPVSYADAYIVDPWDNPCPKGVVGELLIGGPGIALGYLNDDEQTTARFIDNPFAEESGDLYRTGDLVYLGEDGCLRFVGRSDRQIKLRGHRIELAEIERTLLRAEGISQACIVLKEGERGLGPVLIAYAAARESVDEDAVRRHLAAHLPGYMQPSVFKWVDSIPLTANGKTDYAALPAIEEGSNAFVPPSGETEVSIAEFFANLLKVEAFSADRSFFEHGGHSLLAMKLVTTIFVEFGVRLKLRDVMDAPSPRALSKVVDARLEEARKAEEDAADEEVFTF